VRSRPALFLISILVLAACGTGSGADTPAAARAAIECHGPATAASTATLEPVADAPTSTLPVEYEDISGQTVTITDTSRILALDTYGTLGTTVYALGFGDRMVGRDISTGIPLLADLPVVTHNGHELNAEAILELDPSLIITDYTIGPLEVQLQLRDAGIPVVIMSDTRSLEQIDPQIEAVATVLGAPERGTELVERVDAELADAQAHVAELAPTGDARLRMVFLYMRATSGVYYWFGQGSGADDLITELGGVDVATEVGVQGDRPLNAEGLVNAAPDLYLMMTEGLHSVGGIDGLLEVPGVADTQAGADRCVVDMSDDQILSFGPQFPATLTALADAIYGPR
jgi:iron complex transport system substrate-binding protein